MATIAAWTAAPDRTRLPPPLPAAESLDELRRFVVGLARSLARGRVDADDLAQDVFERWLRAAPQLPALDNPRAWLAVVLRRLLFDRLRRARVSSAATRSCAVEGAGGSDDPPPWWRELDVGSVRRELAQLSPPLRETFELFTFEARSYQQIAYQLGIAEGTVGVRISRARAELRRRLTARQQTA